MEFHGNKRQELHHVILHDVSYDTGLYIKTRPVLYPMDSATVI